MRIEDPNFRARVGAMFTDAPFVHGMGVRLTGVEPGICEASLALTPDHLQHLGRVHGGVISTLAGHAAAGAATSLIAPDRYIVAAEFKLNLLRGAAEGTLRCRSEVLKPGALLMVTETEVWGGRREGGKLVAKATHTFTVMAGR